MKFLIFNIAIIGALYYLFANEVNTSNAVSNEAQKAVSRIESLTSSAIAQAREKMSAKETTAPATTPEIGPERLPPVPPPTSAATRNPPVPREMIAEKSINERLVPEESIAEVRQHAEPTKSLPMKSASERRKELLSMAQKMEFLYLRKSGE